MPRVKEWGAPQPPHIPTPESRAECRTLAKVLTKTGCARKMGISFDTLQKYYAEDYAIGEADCSAAIGSKVIKQAMDGDRQSQALYMRTKGGWRTHDEQVNYHLPPAAGILPAEILAELDDADLHALERIARKLARVDPAEPGGESHGFIEGNFSEIDQEGD